MNIRKIKRERHKELDNLINRLLLRVNKDNYFTDTQIEQIKYSILAIGGDFSKFLILLVLFTILGYCPEYLYAFFATTILRLYIGGKHYKTYLGCLLFSTAYFSVLIFLTSLPLYQFNLYFIIVTVVSAAVLIYIAPRISKKSGRKYKVNFYKAKLIIVIIVTTLFVIYVLKKDPIFAIGPFTIILQTIQLLTMKGESYNEIIKEKQICCKLP